VPEPGAGRSQHRILGGAAAENAANQPHRFLASAEFALLGY